jgi:hypothetical protein
VVQALQALVQVVVAVTVQLGHRSMPVAPAQHPLMLTEDSSALVVVVEVVVETLAQRAQETTVAPAPREAREEAAEAAVAVATLVAPVVLAGTAEAGTSS